MNFRQLVKALIPGKLFKPIEPYGHLGEAILFNFIYGFPARKMKVIGVTGTNGKTSTCFLIHKMLVESGHQAGLITTVGWGVGKDIDPQIIHMTNVPVPQLMKRLKQMRKAKVEYLVLETTSHALAQNRVWGIPFWYVVMTNITHEHLDYHGTFESYRASKLKLFKLAQKNHRGAQAGVINADDPSADLFEKAVLAPLTYGVKNGFLQAKNIKSTSSGSTYTAQFGDGDKLNITCHLPGSFNIYNSLAAVGVGRFLHLSNKQIEQGIAALKSVEGRMTTINAGQNFNVFVDFAHTPDSFEKLFVDMQPVVKGKLIVMFGSAGRRDKTKRAVQGEIAGKYCDEVILTEEDDRDEDGNQIMNQIAAGAKKAGKKKNKDLFLVGDRTQAIKLAFSHAKSGDTVLLLGKGHEKTIERADGDHPWDEIETAQRILKKLKLDNY